MIPGPGTVAPPEKAVHDARNSRSGPRGDQAGVDVRVEERLVETLRSPEIVGFVLLQNRNDTDER